MTLPVGADVDIWLGDLTDADNVAPLRHLLDPREITRADRFVQDRHRSRFILRRAFRRIVLGHYLDQPPGELDFDEDGTKKPALVTRPDAPPLHFSTSHSGDQWLMAVSGADIGADTEAPRAITGFQTMIARVCSADEVRLLSDMPPDARLDHFFTLWTVKEAVAKLTGEGLRAPLDAIDTRGVVAPQEATYRGKGIHLSAPDTPGPAKTMLAAFQPIGTVRMRDLSALVRPRLDETGPPGTG